MNLLHCEGSQGVGKHPRGKRKLVYVDRGGRGKFILCLCMYVKFSVFYLKMKIKKSFFAMWYVEVCLFLKICLVKGFDFIGARSI